MIQEKEKKVHKINKVIVKLKSKQTLFSEN